MMDNKKISQTQNDIKAMELDGWLLYDFRRSNELACKFLNISPNTLLTRRFFYWIPAEGEPVKIVHRIEHFVLDSLPGQTKLYSSWIELEKHLGEILRGRKKVAMEYSPRNAIPEVSKVDAGTVELIRSFGIEVVSSGDILQKATAVWDAAKLSMHLIAAQVVDKVVEVTWNAIKDRLKKNLPWTEYDVQQFMLAEMASRGCITQDPPICAVNAHSAIPHYAPEKGKAATLKQGDFILLDIWGKYQRPHAVYADITRVGVAAYKPTDKQLKIFEIVKAARNKATDFVRDKFAKGEEVRGFEIDQVCRQVILNAGYGDYFTHRTGHNIDERDHGPGAHIDSFETKDERHILPGTCFSIEPGIYLPNEFGVRLEYDVFVHMDGKIQVTGGIQDTMMVIS